MSETDISTAAVQAEAKRLRDHGHSGTHGILPVTLALLADRDRLQRENDNLRQIERNVQAVREHEHQRANAAEADRDRLAAEVARLREVLAPFAEFARADSFDRLPDETPMTQGSRLARKQVTAGDFKRALAAMQKVGA